MNHIWHDITINSQTITMPKRVHMNYTRVLIRCEILNRISSARAAAGAGVAGCASATRTLPAF